MASMMQMFGMGQSGGGGSMFGPAMGLSRMFGGGGQQNSSTMNGVSSGLNMAAMIPGPQQPFVMGADVIANIVKMFGV